MKIINLFILVLVCGFSCTPDEGPEPQVKTMEELAVEKLTGNGSIQYGITGGGTVQRDGRNASDNFQGLEFVLSSTGNSKTYAVTNGSLLFESSGSWGFVGSSLDKIMLSGNKPASGVEISYTRTANELILKFSVAVPNARMEGSQAIVGNYDIRLKSN